ncbi:MAG: hypothetical protein WHV64_05495 [Geminicoccaceae bacterium]|jgi:hypothetical protein
MNAIGISSVHLVDAILVLVAIEALASAAWHRRTGRGPPPRRLLPNLLAGAALLAALRTALSGGAEPLLLLWLAIAFAAHLVDLRGRWSEHAR